MDGPLVGLDFSSKVMLKPQNPYFDYEIFQQYLRTYLLMKLITGLGIWNSRYVHMYAFKPCFFISKSQILSAQTFSIMSNHLRFQTVPTNIGEFFKTEVSVALASATLKFSASEPLLCKKLFLNFYLELLVFSRKNKSKIINFQNLIRKLKITD